MNRRQQSENFCSFLKNLAKKHNISITTAKQQKNETVNFSLPKNRETRLINIVIIDHLSLIEPKS